MCHRTVPLRVAGEGADGDAGSGVPCVVAYVLLYGRTVGQPCRPPQVSLKYRVLSHLNSPLEDLHQKPVSLKVGEGIYRCMHHLCQTPASVV